MKVRTQTNLNKRNGVWYFRKKVDADIRADYPTQSIRKSLGRELSAADAKREAAKLAAHYDAEFEAFRQGRQPVPARLLTPDLIPQIAKAHQDAMTGHTTAEVARRYGRCDGYPVVALARSLPALRFGKLDLSRMRAWIC